MIEVIEKELFSLRLVGKYKKAWVVILQDLDRRLYRVITLLSKTTFPLPTSKKRWRLEKRFLREGCDVHILTMEPSKKGRKKYWLSLDEIIRIGNITDESLIEELKRADNTEKELRLNP
jgi:hypothetical protein